jgi:hypothetical protein
VQFDVFLCTVCIDSADFWNHILPEISKDPSFMENVAMRVHIFPLSYFFSAFDSTKAFVLLSTGAYGDAETLKFKYLEAIFKNQAPISNKSLLNTTAESYPAIIYDNFISKIAPNYPREQFLKDMQGIDKTAKIWNETRNLFKYAAARGVFATPQYMVNDATIFNGDAFTAKDWIALFNKVINA